MSKLEKQILGWQKALENEPDYLATSINTGLLKILIHYFLNPPSTAESQLKPKQGE